MNTDLLIKATGLGVNLGGRQILHQVDLELRKGQLLTLIGPNGAGKTTLVRIVLGLIKPDQGSLSRADGMRIGYMPQKLFVEPTLPLTVRRFLQMAALSKSDVEPLLDEVRISHLLDQQVSRLSGGEMQRVLLARALGRNPHLLVLDEPAQGVDVNGQVELYELINSIRARHGCGVLMVSHDLHLVMASTDEVICLNKHICCHGKPEQVSTDPAYLAMFGRREAQTLAVYTHHHNHSHDIKGAIVNDNCCDDHDGNGAHKHG
jgi:zinc transport system ATP-binding protein